MASLLLLMSLMSLLLLLSDSDGSAEEVRAGCCVEEAVRRSSSRCESKEGGVGESRGQDIQTGPSLAAISLIAAISSLLMHRCCLTVAMALLLDTPGQEVSRGVCSTSSSPSSSLNALRVMRWLMQRKK